MNIASAIPLCLALQKLVELNFQSSDFFFPFHRWMINLFIFALGTEFCEHF